MPNPRALTIEQIQEIADYLEQGVSIRGACGLCRVPRQTLYDWLHRGRDKLAQGITDDPDVECLLRIEQAVCRWEHRLVSGIAEDPGRTGGLQFLLERRFRDDYGKRERVDIGGTDAPVRVDLAGMSAQQLRALAWGDEDEG